MKTKSITLFSLIILVCSFSLLSFKPQTFDLKASIARGKEIENKTIAMEADILKIVNEKIGL